MPATISSQQADYDVIVVGGGASGLMAAIAAARQKARVIVCEKQAKPGLKILASGGERCNLTNTLDRDTFMESFGRTGRFMDPALSHLSNRDLVQLFADLGVETKSRDGFRIFPASHRSETVLNGMLEELRRQGADIRLRSPVAGMSRIDHVWKVDLENGESILGHKVVLSTGGLTAPRLGTTGDGYSFAETLGHPSTPTFPGGVPLTTRETWPRQCLADTIGKASIRVALKKHRQVAITGDLIFTRYGIAGKAILDLSGAITPLIAKYGEVPLEIRLRPKLDQQDWQSLLQKHRRETVIAALTAQLPESVLAALAEVVGCPIDRPLTDCPREAVDRMAQILARTPLTVTGSLGYKVAFITTGGIRLKGIEPSTLESRYQPGLFFCGEVMDLDGPCGGYNLQWAFASGHLAGTRAAQSLPVRRPMNSKNWDDIGRNPPLKNPRSQADLRNNGQMSK